MKKILKKVMLAVGGPILMVALLFSVLPVAAQGPAVVVQESDDIVGSFMVETMTLQDGVQLDKITITGSSTPPPGIARNVVNDMEPHQQTALTSLSNVPAFDWVYGCSATSAAMMAGYYDNNGYPNMYAGPANGGVCPMTNATWGTGESPLSATHQGFDGLGVKGHADDYYVSYLSGLQDPYITGPWTQHTYADCTGDYMYTNQSALGNDDGSTTFYNYTNGNPTPWSVLPPPTYYDGGAGLKLFMEARGYTVSNEYNQYIQGYTPPGYPQIVAPFGFTYDDYKAQIDAGRPVLIHVEGHTMLGYGYDDTMSNLVLIHDTWDYINHSFIWGSTYSGMLHYGVTVLELGDPVPDKDYGDAPEGDQPGSAIAYPSTGVTGQFPTCISVPTAGYVEHGLGWAHFVNPAGSVPAWDAEADGNAGACPGCFSPYDLDEGYLDGDAGLMFPEPFTINPAGSVVPCTNSNGTSLGQTCQMAGWGTDVDIDLNNAMPVDGYVNVLMDWNQDGQWSYDPTTQCAGVPVPEHVLVNWPVPQGYSGPLSGLMPPNFQIGPNAGYVWARFTISESAVDQGWTGSGIFEDGESEDYLLLIDSNVKWSQPPDLNDTGIDIRVCPDEITTPDPDQLRIVADDWECTKTSWLTDIHFWGSWNMDEYPQQDPITNLHLSVHTDITADENPNGWSKPGTEVWSIDLPPEAYSGTIAAIVPSEHFWDPVTDYHGGDTQVWRYDIDIPIELAFLQQGTPTKPIVYWLDIAATVNYPPDPTLGFGWKTSTNHWNDAAVYWDNRQGDWMKLVYPPFVEMHAGEPIDMAFELTFEDFEATYDWGDAPDPSIGGTFPTVYANMGPSHLITSLYMGTNIDAEANGQPDPSATLDDITGVPNDEDGVTFSAMQVGQSANATVTSTGNGFVDAWIDFNIDGDWVDPGEYLSGASYPVVAGPNVLPFTVPADATVGATFARFRLSSTGGLSYDDPSGVGAPDGEVEDYMVDIAEPVEGFDFGDALDPPYETLWARLGARHIINTSFYLGNLIDMEPDGQPDPAAMGDDLVGIPDEDGVIFVPTSPLMPGKETAIDVICGPTPGLLDAWVDFSGVNSWADAGEQIFVNQPLVPGVNTLKFTVPAGAVVAPTVARFRLSSSGGLSYTGAAADGEVEDYLVNIVPAGPIYVDIDAIGYNTGGSWTDAYVNLQDALAIAVSGDEIWVADGTYTPVPAGGPGLRTDAFSLKNGVGVYGGFSGVETVRSQRDWATNVTILSGDIGTPGVNTDNCYHVCSNANVDPTAIIDGFTIEDAYADGGAPNDSGGGMLNYPDASPTVTNCVVKNNYVGFAGGGMFNYQNSSPVVTNCTFWNNTASQGGGMDNGLNASPIVTNCTFNANTGVTGGGMDQWVASAMPIVTNCIFWGNIGGEITGVGVPTVTYSDVQGPLFTGIGNINGTPMFVNAVTGDFHLQGISPCLDTGTNSAAVVTTDFEKDNRIIDGDQDGKAIVDMGVDEAETVVIRVDLCDMGSRPVPVGWEVQALIAFFDTTATSTEVLDPATYALHQFPDTFTYNATLNKAEYICAPVAPGIYDITVDGFHTLMNWKQDVNCNSTVAVDVGTLTEGDVDDDGTIGVPDIQAFSAGWLSTCADPWYDNRCDFDYSCDIGVADIQCFSWLQSSPIIVP